MATSEASLDGVESIAVRRKRREKKKSVNTSALEKIKRNRETGLNEETELEEHTGLFDYVEEEEYAKIVQQRQEEGFILDDDGTYCEHGREIFDEEAEASSKDSKGKSKKPGMPKRVAKPTSNIKHMLLSKAGSSGKKKKQEKVSLADDELLNNLLQQIPKESKKPHPSATPTHTNPRTNPFTPRLSSTPQAPRPPTAKKIRITKSHEKPSTKAAAANRFSKSAGVGTLAKKVEPELEDVCGDDLAMDWGGCEDDDWERGDAGEGVSGGGDGVRVTDQPDDAAGWDEWDDEGSETAMVVKKEDKEEPLMEEEKTIVPEAAVSVSGWETVRDTLEETKNAFSGVQVDSSSLPTQQIDGEEVLLFFWLDAYEDTYHQPGTVYLIGKVWVEQAKSYVSCCVVVKNIERCLYFLPREKILIKGSKEDSPEVTFEDLYREFSSKYAEPYNILRFTSKRVLKRYAFDLPDVPSESEYLEVRYSHDFPAPPTNSTGQTFSHVFGTNTSSLERLILKCGLKGPSWLHIKQPTCPHQPISWCKCEAIVQSMNSISVVAEQPPPPPLVVMSLSVKIILNPKTGTNEVLCLGSLVHPDIHLDKPPPKHPFKADLLAIRRPVDRDFPFRFEEHVKKKGYNIEVSPSERAMLAYFLAKLHRVDPDIIVGHNMGSFALEVLQHRMAACRVPQWSRIGRLRRKDLPKGRMAGHWLCAGRPICDVRISAKELIRAKSYDLAELANTVLHKSHSTLDHEDILRAFCSCEQLGGVVAHTMDESMLSLQLMYELNVLPLAYQITCIAGNVFSRTLLGGRAERNEFLLLHAFTAKDYICPDKHFQGKKTQHHHHSEADLIEGGGDDHTHTTSGGHGRRKPAYSGGLVLEPKRGFYDRFILLLDFNSLYPSIMQEYNICFTTIDHAHCPTDEEGGYSKLDLPDLSMPMGILPSEIRVLVDRRRQVKQLMKGAQTNPDLYMQYDIRQKALKLTANSMYGCLGFANSRFHAKPLAALITGKGREILLHTKELAQKLGLDVIYGDTDSIMIDSNTRVLEEAEKIAQKVKVEVNKLYRLLEIDIDGIFKSMLLLRKKKYAAVSIEKRDGKFVENRELKGLDIVRRDWCELAKKSGHYVLDRILSGAPLDDVIEKVREYLQQLQKQIHDGKIELSLFVITKSLTKPPSDYPDKKALPHVQVALRMMSRNQHVQPGDVIPYIMCKGDSHQSAALRAFHPDEIAKQTHLEVDTLYYLQHQVHAVVSRLCEPIEGLDAACIAQCLGLDASKYRSSSGGQEDADATDGGLFGSHGQKKGTFEDVDPLHVTCHKCQKVVCVEGSQCSNMSEGLSCSECKTAFPSGRLINLLSLVIRGHIKRYYAGWLVCEDQSCQFRTRNPTVCLEDSSPKCRNCQQGKLREEYPSSALYRQLVSFEVLFTIRETDNQVLHPTVKERYTKIRTHLARYLDQNQYSKVNLGRLFPVFST